MGAGQDEAVRVGITPAGTLSLVRGHHREVLRRLERAFPAGPEPACLHPALVWAATRTPPAAVRIPPTSQSWAALWRAPA
ncbi:hypothetical protein AB0M05_03920 [Streptomyces violaceusniger]|uniref:hypothetical protein n=1 Tax=Streptomyces violaceusniger TaxID=68280 RepID=UPI0034420775